MGTFLILLGTNCAPTNTLIRPFGKKFLRLFTEKPIPKYYIFALGINLIAIMMEILQRIPKNLTTSPVMADKKCWITSAAALAGGVVSSLIGGNSAAKARKRAQRENTYRSNAEKAWYEKEYNTDYLDTKAGENLMRRAQEVQDNYVRKADGAAAVGGGTAAATAMAKQSANAAMGDTVANIAAQDTSRKQHVSDQHQANVQQLSRERQAIEEQKANDITSAAQNASNALINYGVNQLGSELGGNKSLNNSGLANSKPLVDNKLITDVADGMAHRTNDQGLLNPAAKGKTMLDDAVGDLMKKKPVIPHVGV